MASEFCLIGHPLDHSISPLIHRRLFEFSEADSHYEMKDIDPEQLESKIDFLRGLSGFNVTIPYKQTIVPYLDFTYGRAYRYNSVNTVRCEDGKMFGYNTDVEGFQQALKAAGIELTGKVLLCGAGGVARMMACEALDRGCTLTVATRTISKAQNFLYDLEKMYPDASLSCSTLKYLSGSFDLILNGTPCGMFPNQNDCPVPDPVARSAKAVFDAIYNPIETLLIKKASGAGAVTQNGLPMLVWQAAAAHKIWFNETFTKDQIQLVCDEMEEYLLQNFDQI